MEKIDIKRLIDAINQIAPKAPVTFISDSSFIFRGERLEIVGNSAKTRRFQFTFNSIDSFIESLREFGLMLNYNELALIIKIYRNGSTIKRNGNK